MDYKLTIIITCINEEKVIADVVENSVMGINKHRIKAQILIMDSGTDNSGKIAEKFGAEVIKIKRRGLGQAYLDSIRYIKGNYVIMGDADGNYDFKEVGDFLKKLDKGLLIKRIIVSGDNKNTENTILSTLK